MAACTCTGAEFSGAKSEKLTPRIAETAKALWKIYFALTLAEYAVLWLAGMSHFEAITHAFSTMGTGGFSTRTASIAGFNSPLIEYIIIFFMILAGISLLQQYRLWVERRPASVFRDFEVRLYLTIITGAAGIIGGVLYFGGSYELEPAIRGALFSSGLDHDYHRLRNRELRSLAPSTPVNFTSADVS